MERPRTLDVGVAVEHGARLVGIFSADAFERKASDGGGLVFGQKATTGKARLLPSRKATECNRVKRLGRSLAFPDRRQECKRASYGDQEPPGVELSHEGSSLS